MPRLVPLPPKKRQTSSAVQVDLAEAWNPYDKQARFAFSRALFDLFLGGVGSGKSHALAMWCIHRALANPGSVGALLGRTSIDLQSVLQPALFARLEELQEQSGIPWIADHDRGNALLTLKNGSQIWFRPYNRIEKLRGLTLTWAAADEVEWSEAEPDEVWSVLTGRLRGKGPAPGLGFATSPNGLRGITKKFVDAQRSWQDATSKGDVAEAGKWARYHVVTASSMDNPHLPDHFFDSLKSMSKRRYEQEVKGRVLQPLHTVLQLEQRHMIDWQWREHPTLPRVYGIDWGTGDHHVALMAQVRPDGAWVFADELICDGIPRGQFQERLRLWIDGHGKTAPALFAVDRAVPAENQTLANRYRMTPVRWMDSKEEQRVTSGLELVRDQMDPLDERPMLLFSRALPNAVTGLTAGILPALRGYCYHLDSEGQPTTRPRKDNTFDHSCDALRYVVMAGADMPHLHAGRKLHYKWLTPKPEAVSQPGNSGRQVA